MVRTRSSTKFNPCRQSQKLSNYSGESFLKLERALSVPVDPGLERLLGVAAFIGTSTRHVSGGKVIGSGGKLIERGGNLIGIIQRSEKSPARNRGLRRRTREWQTESPPLIDTGCTSANSHHQRLGLGAEVERGWAGSEIRARVDEKWGLRV